MVLESIIKAESAEDFPEQMFLVGFFYASVGLLLGGLFFGGYASLSAIFITTMPLIMIMCDVMRVEERKDLESCNEAACMREHEKAVILFIFLFLGLIVAYAFWFTILPKDIEDNLFEFQKDVLQTVAGRTVGYATSDLMNVYEIVMNNLFVLGACIIFSFIFGAGAILILVVNASVVGIAIGAIIRDSIGAYAGKTDIGFIAHYFTSFPMSFCFVIVHGIPEMIGYFLGALSGGIISFAVVNHDFGSKDFRRIVIDSLDLLFLSILTIVLSGFIEVYITPAIC